MNTYNQNQYKQKRGHHVATFTINDITYNINLTEHAAIRLNQRNLDLFQCVGAILSLGKQKIREYNNSDKHIFIMDKEHNFSLVISIEDNTIFLITLIDKADCYVRQGTVAINL